MRVFYYCYGSSHSSVVAGAIHTGRLPTDRIPRAAEVQGVRHFDQVRSAEHGTVFPAGRGPDGEDVFVVGLGPGRKVIRRAIASFLDLKGVPREDYLLVDALSRVNPLVHMGGVASRRFGLVGLGRPLVTLGIQLSYWSLVRLVRETQAEVSRRGGGGAEASPRPELP